MAFWQSIIAHDYALPKGANLNDLTQQLLGYLGSTDPRWRYHVAYMILGQWIRAGLYDPQQLRALLKTLTENLTIPKRGGAPEGVCLRSYSALLLAQLMNYDNAFPYLKRHEVKDLLEKSLDYLMFEKDLRAWTKEMGWLHATAHTADLLCALAQSPKLESVELAHLLYTIADRVKKLGGVFYLHDEDARLANTALTALLRNAVTPSIRAAWFVRLKTILDLLSVYDPQVHSAYFNTRAFLRSLYFQLLASDDDQNSQLLTETLNTLLEF